MGKKHKKNKDNLSNKEKYIPMYRTKEERILETKPIIEKLTELGLTLEQNNELKELFILIKTYIQDGERLEINIPFPSINRRIKGILATNIREEVSIRMISEKY